MLVNTLSLPFGKIDPNRICSEVGIAPVLCRQALVHVPGLDGAVDRTRGDHFSRWRRLLRRLTATFIHPSAWKRFSRTFAKNVSRDLVHMGEARGQEGGGRTINHPTSHRQGATGRRSKA